MRIKQCTCCKSPFDSDLIPLLMELNRNGYITTHSCQGTTKGQRGHDFQAYISFKKELPKPIQRKLHGLVIEGCTIRAQSVYIHPEWKHYRNPDYRPSHADITLQQAYNLEFRGIITKAGSTRLILSVS